MAGRDDMGTEARSAELYSKPDKNDRPDAKPKPEVPQKPPKRTLKKSSVGMSNVAGKLKLYSTTPMKASLGEWIHFRGKHFLTYETGFVLVLAVLENSVLPIG